MSRKEKMKRIKSIQEFKAKKTYSDKIVEEYGDLIVDDITTSRAKLLELANMIDAMWNSTIKPRDVDSNKDMKYDSTNTRTSPNSGNITENPYDPDSFVYSNNMLLSTHREFDDVNNIIALNHFKYNWINVNPFTRT